MTGGDYMVLRYEFRILHEVVTGLRLAKFAVHFEIPKPYDTICKNITRPESYDTICKRLKRNLKSDSG